MDTLILDDVLGLAYLYRYLGNQGYEMAAPEDPALLGEGLWLATDEPFIWTMDGDLALSGVSVPLRNGWTLVGFPLWFYISCFICMVSWNLPSMCRLDIS